MSKIIDADELELDTEWSDYYDGFTSYSQSQIDEAEEIKAIRLEKVKHAREEIKECSYNLDIDSCNDNERVVDLNDVLTILDKLIEEVEG